MVLFIAGCAPMAEVETSGAEVALVETVAPDVQVTNTPTLTNLPAIFNGDATAPMVHVALDGADGQAGTAEAPWRTIQFAVDHVPAGGIVVVHGGDYAGARLERSGTAEAPFTLMGAAGEEVVIDRPGPNNRHESNLEIETWEESETVAYWIVEGLTVTEAPNWGIDVRGNSEAKNHHIVIRNNYVHNNGWEDGKTGIFVAHSDYVTIEGNETENNGEHGIYVNNSSDHFTIRQNHAHHNANSGIHLNGDASAGDDGILSFGLIEGNVIDHNGAGGGAAINMDGVTDSVVQNNLLYANEASGIAIFQQDGAICSQRNKVYHNTIHMPDNGRWAVIITQADCVDNSLLNNIIYSDHSYRGSINLPTTAVSGLISDYNIVTDRFTTDDSDSVIGLSAWQALGYDQHSFIATPSELFAATAEANYQLRSGSPAIDAGTNLTAVVRDLAGVTRPQGIGYDIGAYERENVNELIPTPNPETAGVIVYRLGERVYRVNTAVGTPEDLTAALDALYPAGADDWVNISPDGQWLLFSSPRFDPECVGWACLILTSADLSSYEVITAGDSFIHPDTIGAVASGGNVIVYPADGETHATDLFVIARAADGWGDPVNLTATHSPHDYNEGPALSADGTTLLFDCGPTPYRQEGTAVCEIGIDGSGFREVVRPIDGPGSSGTADASVAHADYGSSGEIVFEADWDGEFIWRIPVGGGAPEKIGAAYSNDNSPCVLPNGRIASLWLNRPGNGVGVHELKVMSAVGGDEQMVLIDVDVVDAGIGCGEVAK
ncbi:MAG: right-handed parallel beta-helix repeat-containing protein [Anaerolineales bacterium]|nr:right-handed parallel beta-helix repeat-containing protein [Anaerolineales bacterium]